VSALNDGHSRHLFWLSRRQQSSLLPHLASLMSIGLQQSCLLCFIEYCFLSVHFWVGHPMSEQSVGRASTHHQLCSMHRCTALMEVYVRYLAFTWPTICNQLTEGRVRCSAFCVGRPIYGEVASRPVYTGGKPPGALREMIISRLLRDLLIRFFCFVVCATQIEPCESSCSIDIACTLITPASAVKW